MRRIGGRLRSAPCGGRGGNGEIPPFTDSVSNRAPLSGAGTAAGGQFDWGGRLLKSNGGAQRFPQPGWKSGLESVKAQGSLTVRQTSRTGTKVGLSDPPALNGKAGAHRTKATPGITGLSCPRVHIDGKVWHLDVGSSHPGAGVGPKGWAVRPLKRYASWVQNVVRQFGLYPPQALDACPERPPVREDRGGPTAGAPVVSPEAPLGSYVGSREALTASKREAHR